MTPAGGRKAPRSVRRWAAVLGLTASTLLIPFIVTPASAASQATVAITNDGTGADSDYTLTLTLGAALTGSSAEITAIAPTGTNFRECTAYITDETDPADSGGADCFTGSNSNTLVIRPYNNIRGPHKLSIRINNVDNPPNPVAGATLSVATSAEPTPVKSAAYDIAARSVGNAVVTAENASPGATSGYTLKLRTSGSGALRSDGPRRVTVIAPNGYNFRQCDASVTDLSDSTGTGGADCNTGANVNTMVLDLYNAVGANNDLSFALTNITNPSTSDPQYTWRISTSSDQTPVNSAPFAIGSSTSSSPTPGPRPTASPSPSRPTSNAPPTVELSTDAISAGETVDVTYDGVPGATVDVMSRTQPSTVFTKIGSVTLDADGFGTSSHRPQKNTRIAARNSDGVFSELQPIIAVRSVASFNVRRLAPRTYEFTGRVYPALNRRLVNIYRDGRLVGQPRCDASGIYRVTRTLGAGTSLFQARTPNDQDNLGTTSPTRQVTIS